MKKLAEITFFERLLESPRNELIEQAVAQGRVPLGYNCYVVPRPLLSVGKAFPVRLSAPGVQSTEMADYYMSSYTCSCARAILETGLTGGYSFLDGMVWANSCQHITRCGQHFTMKEVNSDKDTFFVHMLEAPRKLDVQDLELFYIGLKKVAAQISDKFKIDMSDEALRQAIRQQNDFNSLLQEIANLRQDDHPRITGSEFHKLIVATQLAPQDMLVEPIIKLQDSLKERQVISDYRARLMVVGPLLDNPRYIELIEEQGALVVSDRFCWGSQPGLELITPDGDPYFNLAKHYLQNCECARMMDKSQERIDKLVERVKEFNVEGIVIETVKFCDMWGYELLTLQNGLKEAGISFVKIEREYAFAGEGQFRTRIQAFIESIENKRLSKTLREGVI